MSETMISLQHIEKSYGRNKVLQDVNLEIRKGDIFGLVGKNGAGKTTLFKVLLGLSVFEGGEISFGEGVSLEDGRRKVGFLIGSNFFDNLSPRENLEYYRTLKGIRDKKEIDRVLRLVGLEGVKKSYKSFSLGMRQRLGIANALMGNPEILILDEPTNGLDPQGIADIRNLVQKINREYGTTVIISSHILGELQHTAHRFGIMNNGTIARVISQEELLEGEKEICIRVEDLERAREVLEKAGIPVLREEKHALSLEDFYFELVGGKEHA